MKAWQVLEHGNLKLAHNVPDPTPQSGEALISVTAVGLNHLDNWVLKGVSGHKFPLPLTPGTDNVGIIKSFGSTPPKDLQVGDRVLIGPGISCGRCEACLSGDDPLCSSYGIFGETQNGGCADLLVAPIRNLIKIPAGLPDEIAAAIPIPYLTAWSMLVRKAGISPGCTILVQAGGSGVGVAAIQIAKLFGARVVTTVGSSEKIKKAEELGADIVINYSEGNLREKLKAALASLACKKGFDIAVDHVGASTFTDSLKSLAKGGKLVCCGATTGANVEIDLKLVFFKNLSILGTTMGNQSDLIKIVNLVAQNRLKPKIDSIFSFEDLPKALSRLDSRQVFGKLILK